LPRWVIAVRANFCARQNNLRVIQPLYTSFLSSVPDQVCKRIVRPNDFDRVWDVYQNCRDSSIPVIVQPRVFPQLDQRNARSRLQNYFGEYFQALSRYTQDVRTEFLVNQQGPKVPWVLVFFDFVGCYLDLSEWVDGKKLQQFVKQFKTRCRSSTTENSPHISLHIIFA